jgi:hypothetical protein
MGCVHVPSNGAVLLANHFRTLLTLLVDAATSGSDCTYLPLVLAILPSDAHDDSVMPSSSASESDDENASSSLSLSLGGSTTAFFAGVRFVFGDFAFFVVAVNA